MHFNLMKERSFIPVSQCARLVAAFLLTGAVWSCANPFETTMLRTNLSGWSIRAFPSLGIQVELPTDVALAIDRRQSAEDEEGRAQPDDRGSNLALATAYWQLPPEVHDEDAYIQVLVTRMTSEQRKVEGRDYKANNPRAKSWEWADWYYKLHLTISERSGTDGHEYRRDITLPNGEIAEFHIIYVGEQFTSAEQREDLSAIQRILNSARPIAPAMSSGTRRPN